MTAPAPPARPTTRPPTPAAHPRARGALEGRRLVVRLPSGTVDVTFHALGTDVRLIASGVGARAAVARARAAILDYHARLTRFDPGSELCALNADPRPLVPASPLLRAAVRAGLWAARRSGGLVDPCLLAALEAAGYERSFDRRPPPPLPHRRPARPAAPDPKRRWRAIHVDDDACTIARPIGLRLDLGGSGKGHVADLVASCFKRCAEWVVDCGGDIRVGGGREIEIAHPLRDERAAEVRLAGGAIATSSIVARAWHGDGGRHVHHLLDPSTGAPVWTGLLSATALAPTTLHAETLAKVALLGGADVARVALSPRGGLLVHASAEVEPIGALA